MSEKMKPCPFCGGEASIKIHDFFDDTRLYTPKCKCGASIVEVFHTEDEAIAAWNTRDVRTCRYVGDEISGGCSECHGWLDPACSYCPSCGAKVMSEEEQGHAIADAIRRLEKAVER